jgi:polyisoprenoid-binding protein YceI
VVAGSLSLSGPIVTDLAIAADLSQIVTNASRRDRAVQRALDTGTFPIATFTLTDPIDIGAVPANGEPVQVVAVGELEIKGVTQSIEIPLETQLVSDLIVVVGGVDITFADWGVEMPSAPGVVSVEDHGILEIQLFFSRSPNR